MRFGYEVKVELLRGGASWSVDARQQKGCRSDVVLRWSRRRKRSSDLSTGERSRLTPRSFPTDLD